MLESNFSLGDGWDLWQIKAQCGQRWPHSSRKHPEQHDGVVHQCFDLGLGNGGRLFVPEGLL
jgi:hypothetical protein